MKAGAAGPSIHPVGHTERCNAGTTHGTVIDHDENTNDPRIDLNAELENNQAIKAFEGHSSMTNNF